MEKVIDRIEEAISHQERILIFGDYDVDGITSTALLFSLLREFSSDLYYYIPQRGGEGYGLSEKVIDLARENGFTLIITVDCGINSVLEIEKARNYGIEVIVVDHHKPPEEVPAALGIINPKYEDGYPFKELAGVGVCFKLAQALGLREKKDPRDLYNFLDYVVLGTIADAVPFLDENRILIREGLKVLNQTPREGLKALISESGIEGRDLKVKEVNFALAPRLNAAGRLDDPQLALELLLADSPFKAQYLAKKLNEINRFRQDLSNNILEEARRLAFKQIKEENNKILVLSSEDWNQGLVGIIASRLVEEFNRPAIVISKKEGIGKGSGRSIKGFSLYEVIQSCQDVLINYGGHKYAVGFTIEANRISQFKAKINAISSLYLKDDDLTLKLEVDAPLSLNEINLDLIKEINTLEPFGVGNPQPIFCSYNNKILDWRIVGESKEHLKLKIIEKNKVFDGIGFGLGKEVNLRIKKKEMADLAFNLEMNKWQGRENIQLNIKDLKNIF